MPVDNDIFDNTDNTSLMNERSISQTGTTSDVYDPLSADQESLLADHDLANSGRPPSLNNLLITNEKEENREEEVEEEEELFSEQNSGTVKIGSIFNNSNDDIFATKPSSLFDSDFNKRSDNQKPGEQNLPPASSNKGLFDSSDSDSDDPFKERPPPLDYNETKNDDDDDDDLFSTTCKYSFNKYNFILFTNYSV